MDDLERRLRAALSAAAEQAPPGLMDAVLSRRRRHRRRVGAGALAVTVAIAVAAPAAALHVGSARGRATPREPAASISPSPVTAAAPGTVLSGCGAANSGSIGANWRARALHEVGPLWLIDGGHSRGRLELYVAVLVLDRVRAGSAVVLRVAPSGRRYLRFLYGPLDTMSPGASYTMRSGESGVTFASCPGQGPMPTAGTTSYYGGFLVQGARCVPVQVWAPGRLQPSLIRLGACPG